MKKYNEKYIRNNRNYLIKRKISNVTAKFEFISSLDTRNHKNNQNVIKIKKRNKKEEIKILFKNK